MNYYNYKGNIKNSNKKLLKLLNLVVLKDKIKGNPINLNLLKDLLL